MRTITVELPDAMPVNVEVPDSTPILTMNNIAQAFGFRVALVKHNHFRLIKSSRVVETRKVVQLPARRVHTPEPTPPGAA